MLVAWGEDGNRQNKTSTSVGLANDYFMLRFYVSTTNREVKVRIINNVGLTDMSEDIFSLATSRT